MPRSIIAADLEQIDLRVPAAIAWKESEHALQKHIIRRCALMSGRYPDLEWLHAIPNGGHRSKAAAGKMRAEGQKKGVPDLCLPVPRRAGDRLYHGLYLELKKAGGAPSEDQREWLLHLHRSGYAAHVANDPDTAVKLILDYLSLSPP